MDIGSCHGDHWAFMKALQYRMIARAGGDPLLENRRAKIVVPTFAEAALNVVCAENLIRID
jgi:hypothetical protein